jgi:hypothetical protein
MTDIRFFKRWQDELILLLGIWLFLTPWIFGYSIPSPHATNAFACGLIMTMLAAFDLYKIYFWAVALNLVLGIWVAVSPWIFFADFEQIPMMWNNLAVGIVTALLAGWELAADPDLHKWQGTAT